MAIESLESDKGVLIIIDPRDSSEEMANTEEIRLLAESAGVDIVDELHVRRSTPDSRYFIGKGHSEDAYIRVQDSEANLVIVSEELSPTQQRNLSKTVTVEVIDRTQLILNIFAQRARTSEGKLQVELAQLQYLLPRLTGYGTEMSRIGGGSSGGLATRGPGETKLETDRRRVRKKIDTLKQDLDKVVRHRATQNKARRKMLVPAGSLVGYTSAGKSTLLNLLSDAGVEAHARLFATLDPTTRRVELPEGCAVIISDTVGFLRNLPHALIAAFRATLEEVVESDFLIHVVDASHPYSARQKDSVIQVLDELGATDKTIITVFNKADAVKDTYELRRLVADTPNSCYMSALTGEGLEQLTRLICHVIGTMNRHVEVLLPFGRGDILAMCHERGRVIKQQYREDGVYVIAEVPPDLAAGLSAFRLPKEQD